MHASAVKATGVGAATHHVSMLRPQGGSVSTKLTKQVDVTGSVKKLHFVGSVFSLVLLSLSASKIRSLLNINQNDSSWIHVTRSSSEDGRRIAQAPGDRTCRFAVVVVAEQQCNFFLDIDEYGSSI